MVIREKQWTEFLQRHQSSRTEVGLASRVLKYGKKREERMWGSGRCWFHVIDFGGVLCILSLGKRLWCPFLMISGSLSSCIIQWKTPKLHIGFWFLAKNKSSIWCFKHRFDTFIDHPLLALPIYIQIARMKSCRGSISNYVLVRPTFQP